MDQHTLQSVCTCEPRTFVGVTTLFCSVPIHESGWRTVDPQGIMLESSPSSSTTSSERIGDDHAVRPEVSAFPPVGLSDAAAAPTEVLAM